MYRLDWQGIPASQKLYKNIQNEKLKKYIYMYDETLINKLFY